MDAETRPAETAPPATEPARPGPALPHRSFASKFLGLVFVIFCFEVGVFLVVFPWMSLWEINSLPAKANWLIDIWGSPYFRGALSGVGLVNIYISFSEMVRLIRG